MKKRHKKTKKKRRRPADEGVYVCPSCGEQIVTPLDRSAGAQQEYIEDCPVCCNPNVIHLEFFGEGESPRVWAEAE
jgi:rubrerythrin